MRTHDLNIDDSMVIPKGTYFWSINLQESICLDRDKVIRVTKLTYHDDYVFGVMQEVYENTALSAHFEDDSDPRSYVDNRNEIGINAHKLVRYVPPPNLLKGMASFRVSWNNSGTTNV